MVSRIEKTCGQMNIADIPRLMRIFSDKRFKEKVRRRAEEAFGCDCTEKDVKEVLSLFSSEIVSEYKKYSAGRDKDEIMDFTEFAEDWIDKNCS